MIHACGVDPLNPGGRPTPANLKSYGFQGIRSVFRDAPEWYSYHRAAKLVGLQSIITLARESFGDRPQDEILSNLPADADMVVIGNEPDGEGPSSWKMSPSSFRTLIGDCAPVIRRRCPQALIAAGGLVSGQPSWLEPIYLGIALAVDFLDIHPYAKTAQGAQALLTRYHDLTMIPIVILEWNRPPNEIGDFARMLGEQTSAAAWFCWSDAMVDGLGLVDRQGNPKPHLAAMQAALQAQPPGPLPEPPHYVLGFEKWHDLEPSLLGEALKNERSVATEWQIQPTTRGILSWVAGKGHAFVTHDGRIFRWQEDWPASREIS